MSSPVYGTNVVGFETARVSFKEGLRFTVKVNLERNVGTLSCVRVAAVAVQGFDERLAVANDDFVQEEFNLAFPGLGAMACDATNVIHCPASGSCLVEFETLSDGRVEGAEVFGIRFGRGVNVEVDPEKASMTVEIEDVLDPDVGFEMEVPARVVEGEASLGRVRFRGRTEIPIEVQFETIDGQATALGDWPDVALIDGGRVVFAPNSGGVDSSHEIPVAILDDLQAEESETFGLRVAPIGSDVSGIPELEVELEIIDDDQGLSLSVEGNSVREGDLGRQPAQAVARVFLSTPAPAPIQVMVAVESDSARKGDDFGEPISTSIEIPAGQRSANVNVPIIGDRTPEEDERFVVRIVDASDHVVVEKESVSVLILDDDDEEGESIGASIDPSDREVTIVEGSPAVIGVTLSRTPRQRVNVTYSLNLVAKEQCLRADGRFVGPLNGVVSFPPGETNGEIRVETHVDDNDQANCFYVELERLFCASSDGECRALVTIKDESRPACSLGVEPTSPTTLTKEVKNDGGQEEPVSLTFHIPGDGDGSAEAVPMTWVITGPAVFSGGMCATVGGKRCRFAASLGSDGVVEVTPTDTGNVTVTGTVDECADGSSQDYQITFAASKDVSPKDLDEVAKQLCEKDSSKYVSSLDPACKKIRRGNSEQVLPEEVDSLPKNDFVVIDELLNNVFDQIDNRAPGWRNRIRLHVPIKPAPGEAPDELGHDVLPIDAQGPPPARRPTSQGPALFAIGSITVARGAPRQGSEGFDLSSRGLILGADKLFGRSLLIGGGLNVFSGEASLGTRDRVSGHGVAAVQYGSYSREDVGSIDWVAAYGLHDYRLRRGISVEDGLLVARGAPTSEVTAISVRGTWEPYVTFGGEDSNEGGTSSQGPNSTTGKDDEHDNDHNQAAVSDSRGDGPSFEVSLLGRLDFASSRTTGFRESGAGMFDLVIASRRVASLTAHGGGQIQKNWTVDRSVAINAVHAAFRFAYLRTAASDRPPIVARFVDDPFRLAFSTPVPTVDRDYFRAGLDLRMEVKQRWRLFLTYETDLGRDDLEVHRLGFGVHWAYEDGR